MAQVAQVEPLTSARALRGPFDYALPEDMRDSVGIGSMLVVPFGRRELLGVVVGLADGSELEPERLLAPRRAFEADVPVDLVELAGWIAGEYCSTPAPALAALRRDGGKGIVLLNRRGWSNFLSCRSCGRVWGCPECDVALVLHRAEGLIACHHCGHREHVPASCDACGSRSVARHGLGTERLEHELAAALGGEDYPFFRLDADTAAGKGRAAVSASRRKNG